MRAFRGYQARNTLERSKPPTRREILAAIEAQAPGSVRVRSRQVERLYLDGLSGFCPELAAVRSDGRETVLTFARLLAARANFLDGTTWHSREARCQEAERGETAWKVVRRRLQAWGWLVTVRPGRIYWLGDESRHDAAVYALCIPRSILRKIAGWRRRAFAHPLTRPPTGEPSGNTQAERGAPGDQRERDGPASGRAALPGRPRNAELAAGGGAAGEMAALFRQTLGQDLSDGWCGWFGRRILAAGWTLAEVAEQLAGVPPRHEWDYVLRTCPPQLALMFWLRRLPAEHWADEVVMKPSPARVRRGEARANLARQLRGRAEREARAAAPEPGGPTAEYLAARAALFARARPRARSPQGKEDPR